ncbi:MAG: hypothetical protein R3F23_02735 [Verrucomicrobiia bacterium]
MPYFYAEDFNQLGINPGFPYPWEDNVNRVGWYWIESTPSGDHTVPALIDNDGSKTQPAPYYFGTSTEVALGAIPGNGLNYVWEIKFYNNNFLNITNIDISFVVEQWNDNSLTPQSLSLFYYIGNNSKPEPNDWIPLSHPGLTAPQSSSQGILNGNLPANQNLVSISLPSTAMVVNPGQRFWLRWEYRNNGGSSYPGLGIDNLTIDFQGEKVPIFAEFTRPRGDTFLKYRSKKGFKIKGRIGLEEGVETEGQGKGNDTLKIKRISYATYRTELGETFIPADLEFTEFGRFKALKKGRLYRKGYRAVFKTGKGKNRAGRGLKGSAPLHMAFKVEYDRMGLANTVYYAHTFFEPEIK